MANATKWFHSSLAYQIWPASFKDSNADGVGDIQGIISKIPYIQETLSIDMLWLSPIYDSPQKDMGYDVSNYEAIYPKYGTLEDFDQLVACCHGRGIKVVMDMVANHTSDQHEWFLSSMRSREGEHADWYHWRDPRYSDVGERRPPNNWRTGSKAGKSCWTYVPERGQYYFHFGTPYQPNLNWGHAGVREAVYESAIKFWLKRGVDGFRMDVVGFYWKDPDFPDAKVVYEGAELQPLDGRYCHNGELVHVWLKDLRRRIHQEYGDDIVLIGELPGTIRQTFLNFIHPASGELDMALDTDIFITGNDWTDGLQELKRPALPLLKDAIYKTQSMLDDGGWPTVFIENHDFARSVSRFGPGDGPFREQGAKMLALLATTLSGTLFIYQGQEIGMTNVPLHWTKKDFRDHYDLGHIEEVDKSADERAGEETEWNKALATWGRDNGRTPMHWSSQAYAGFSERQPWIGVNDNYPQINVAEQLGRPDSVLAFWKLLTSIRKGQWSDQLIRGTMRLVDRDDMTVFAYTKSLPGKMEELLIVLNFSDHEATTDLQSAAPGRRWEIVVATRAASAEEGKRIIKLQPWEGRLYQSTLLDA